MANDSPKNIVLEFLAEFASDRVAGAVRPLAYYLARYPGADAELAAEYAATLGVRSVEEEGDATQLGSYRLLRELGRGGQGVVWLAEDRRIGRRVALKIVLKPPTALDLAPRLRREASAAARVEHPGLCPIYDVGSDDERAWIAMRYVEGETLATRIERDMLGSLDQRLELIEQVARALHAAHEAGVVHRDVKPGNVMIQASGEPVVLDFGIARADDGAPQLTLTGDAIGTPAYMSPEQLRGEHADRRADVWSLGVTAFEAVTGRRPFDAPTRDALVRAILESEAPDAREHASHVPRDLNVVLATALERDLTRRYRTALDFAEDVRRVRKHEPIRARPASAALRVRRWAQRNPKLAVSLAALSCVLISALLVTSSLLSRTRNALERRDALVRDVSRLSDQTLASELIRDASNLWPATESSLPGLERWLAQADDLLSRRERHEMARTTLAARTDLDPDPVRNAAAREWLVEQLDKLLASLTDVQTLVQPMHVRADFARELRALSIDAPRDQWARAIERVGADSRFHGLKLQPQMGLVPLGPDPRTKLEEFAHLASGRPPVRDAQSGMLAISGESAIVLVLVPAGEFDLGAMPPNAEHAIGTANVDRWAEQWDYPVVHAALDAFFVSKYELTRGQWLRHTGADPSTIGVKQAASQVDPLRHPVDTISWDASSRVLHELALELPTEAQWECAARAGTTTVFFTGDEVESLQGHANVADRTAQLTGPKQWQCAPELDDGFEDSAPVGSFLANGFGMHDVHGNVAEWCRDTWEELGPAQPRAGDGLIQGHEPTHVQRGGGFSHHPRDCRIGYRSGSMPSFVAPMWGCRAARAIE